MLVLAAAAQTCRAADGYRPSSGAAARKDAIASLPLDRVDETARRKISAVLEKTSVFRRLPTQVIRCDPVMYQYVVEHPEILANVWQLLEIEDVVLTPNGPGTYSVSDGAGTSGSIEYLYRSHDTQLIYLEGSYDGPMFAQAVHGACVALLKTGMRQETDGRYYVTTRLDVFMRLDNVGLDLLAKTFHPLVVRVADYNFTATVSFVESLSSAAENGPERVERLAVQLTNIPKSVQTGLIDMAYDVRERSVVRQAQYEQYSQPQARLSERPTARGQN